LLSPQGGFPLRTRPRSVRPVSIRSRARSRLPGLSPSRPARGRELFTSCARIQTVVLSRFSAQESPLSSSHRVASLSLPRPDPSVLKTPTTRAPLPRASDPRDRSADPLELREKDALLRALRGFFPRNFLVRLFPWPVFRRLFLSIRVYGRRSDRRPADFGSPRP